jgi:hypothetical protein
MVFCSSETTEDIVNNCSEYAQHCDKGDYHAEDCDVFVIVVYFQSWF